MKKRAIILLTVMFLLVAGADPLVSKRSKGEIPYKIIDTGQVRCFDNYGGISYRESSSGFWGQDAHYRGLQPSYIDNHDGTVSDLNTGLMWTRDPGSKKTYRQAVAGASRCQVGGHDDWRLPTIKELYSLILFSGGDFRPGMGGQSSQKPFIDNVAFKFKYGDTSQGERVIDSQYATCTLYGSTTMGGNKTMFGVNFADGRIKGYPIEATRGRREKTYYVMYVRGNPEYGKNDFVDNGDGTVTDRATGLMWMKVDSGKLDGGKMNWKKALEWAENLEYAGHTDWRLPNAKELQSIVDYSRCPDVTGSAAIDPVFEATSITNERGQTDYPFYWTGTTHEASGGSGREAVYISFGRTMGYMWGKWLDVHGAGAQRCDPKVGGRIDYSKGRGPQGDAVRIYNYVRCVRGGVARVQKNDRSGRDDQAGRGSRGGNDTGQWTSRQGQGMGPGQGQGMRPGQGQGMGPGQGQGMGPGQGQGMGSGRGQGMGSGRGQGMGSGRGQGMGPGRGQGMGPGRGQGMGSGQGQGMGPGQGQGVGQSSSGERFIRRLDRDGDGKVSREEFDGPGEHFDRFDRDGDGYISKEEAPKGPPPRRRGRQN